MVYYVTYNMEFPYVRIPAQSGPSFFPHIPDDPVTTVPQNL